MTTQKKLKRKKTTKPTVRPDEALGQLVGSSLIPNFDELAQGSDRACVILVAALIEDKLSDLFKAFLLTTKHKDPLFQYNGPLSTLAAKIGVAHRLGLISKDLARDLNRIRDIRNDFAHAGHPYTFETHSVKDRVSVLLKSFPFVDEADSPTARKMMPDPLRRSFVFCSIWILVALTLLADGRERVGEAPREDMYLPRTS